MIEGGTARPVQTVGQPIASGQSVQLLFVQASYCLVPLAHRFPRSGKPIIDTKQQPGHVAPDPQPVVPFVSSVVHLRPARAPLTQMLP
jgi:hypothetical protein